MKYHFYLPTEADDVLGKRIKVTNKDIKGKYLTNARMENSALMIDMNFYEVLRFSHINNKVTNVVLVPLIKDILHSDYNGKVIEL